MDGMELLFLFLIYFVFKKLQKLLLYYTLDNFTAKWYSIKASHEYGNNFYSFQCGALDSIVLQNQLDKTSKLAHNNNSLIHEGTIVINSCNNDNNISKHKKTLH